MNVHISWLQFFPLYLSFLWFYLFKIEQSTCQREHKRGCVAEAGEGQADSPPIRELHVGLNPRTLRSQPEPKAEAQPAEHPRRPSFLSLIASVGKALVPKDSLTQRCGDSFFSEGHQSPALSFEGLIPEAPERSKTGAPS